MAELAQVPRTVTKVNLGCGSYPREGYFNVEGWPNPKVVVDLVYDLNRIPYPFEAGTVETVLMEHSLEHLENPFAVLAEIHRMLKSGGRAIIRVPHFSRGFTHADHRRGFDITFPFYFSPKFVSYIGPEFKSIRTKLSWMAQGYHKRDVFGWPLYFALVTVSAVLSFLANLSPMLCSRVWCYWFGGFEEVEFILEKP